MITNLTPAIIANPTVSYISPRATGTLTIVPQAFATGTATFEVSVIDDGGTANGGVNISAPQLVTVTIEPVNQQPNINSITNITLPENSGQQRPPQSISTGGTARSASRSVPDAFGGSPFYQAAPAVVIAPPGKRRHVKATGHGRESVRWHGHQQHHPHQCRHRGYTSTPAVTIGPLNIALTGINPGTGESGTQTVSGPAPPVSSNNLNALIPVPSITYPNVNPTTGLPPT